MVHKVFDAPDKAAALQPVAERIRGVVTNAMAGLPSTTIEALPNLEICAIMGVGLEKTDLTLAKARGIVVTTTPVLYDDVSDLAVILGMTACRRIAAADRFVRSGQWLQGRMPPAQKFSGKRAGILGLGRIGTALCARLQGFGMTIGYYDPLPKAGVPYQAYDFGDRPGAELGHPVPLRRRRTDGGPHRHRRGPRRARAQGRVRQRRARLAGRREGAGRGADGRAGSAPPGWTCSRTSRTCRRRCSRSTTWS